MSDTPPPHALLRPQVALPFLLVALIWGSTWLVIKDGLATLDGGAVPPGWSVTYRFAIAAIGMAALALWRGQRLVLDRQGQLMALALGLTQFCLNFNLVYRAEQYITSGIVAVLFALLILPNSLLGRVFLGVRLSARFLVGTGIALAGIALMLWHEAQQIDLDAAAAGGVLLGVALTCGAIFSASVANVLQAAPSLRRQNMLVLLTFAMLWGTLFDAVLAWLLSGPPVLPGELRYWGGVAYLAIIGSVVTFPLYFQLIREIGPGRAAYNGVLVPVVAMGLSTLFEDYRWSWLAGGGAVLAMVGLIVAMRARNPS